MDHNFDNYPCRFLVTDIDAPFFKDPHLELRGKRTFNRTLDTLNPKFPAS